MALERKWGLDAVVSIKGDVLKEEARSWMLERPAV